MKKFIFDMQRFEDLATVSFGEDNSDGIIEVNSMASISSGINIVDETQAIGSDSADIFLSERFTGKNYLSDDYKNYLISLGGGEDTIYLGYDTGSGHYYAANYANITINSGADNDVIHARSNYQDNISFSEILINSEDGADYINISVDELASNTKTYAMALRNSTVTLEGGDGDDTIRIYSESVGSVAILGVNGSINGGSGDDQISIYGGEYGIRSYSAENVITLNGGAGSDIISIYGGTAGITSPVLIDGGDGSDTISVSSIDSLNSVTDALFDSLNSVSIIAGSGDNISVGSGGVNYLFDSTDEVTINGATFTASSANTSASLESSADIMSIKSAWSGTVALSGTNSLADIDGSIVSDAGNYQIVDGKLVGAVEPVNPQTGDIVIANGKKYDVVFVIDNTGSMRQYIDDVKSNVNEFAQTLQNSGLNCRYGLVEFGDLADSEIKTYEFTDDVGVFVSNVNNISLTDGGDYPESGLEAIMNGALTMNFDADAEKRFIVVSDASFKNFDETGDGNSAEYLVTGDVENALRDNAVTMDVVGEAGSCRSEWEPLANGTGGKFYLLGSGFPSIFSAITTDIINIVDLNLVPENQTGYFVATQNSNTYTTPIFQTSNATGNDTAVGTVNEVNVYVADSDTDRQQTIIITDGWNATATKSADKLLITATIRPSAACSAINFSSSPSGNDNISTICD